jgi:pimeloyl-ACP methyl ester carboxylesterase
LKTPTIVFLHGLASNGSRWWDFVARTRLKGWRILRPDLRGAAGSTDRRPVGMREWSDDLARLLDAEGAPRAVVAGHCLGANIALNFAALHPLRAAALVLIEPMPPRALTGKLGFLRHFRFIPIVLSWLVRGLNAIGIYRRHVEPMDLEAWDRAVRAGTANLAVYSSPFSDLRFTPLASYFRALAAVGDPLPDLAPISCPVLVLTSKNTNMTDLARARAELQPLRGAEFVQLDAEHWIPTEQPEAMCRAIEDWIARKGLEKAL